MQVYDYDWGLRDDFMGQGQVCLSPEQVGGGAVSTLVTLVEAGARARESLGRVSLATTLAPLQPDTPEHRRASSALASFTSPAR